MPEILKILSIRLRKYIDYEKNNINTISRLIDEIIKVINISDKSYFEKDFKILQYSIPLKKIRTDVDTPIFKFEMKSTKIGQKIRELYYLINLKQKIQYLENICDLIDNYFQST